MKHITLLKGWFRSVSGLKAFSFLTFLLVSLAASLPSMANLDPTLFEYGKPSRYIWSKNPYYGLWTESFNKVLESNEAADDANSFEYFFPFSKKLSGIQSRGMTTLAHDKKNIYTLDGRKIHKSSKGEITSFDISPTERFLATVETNKKGTTAYLYPIRESITPISTFNSVEFGNPVSIRFTKDGRQALVITAQKIYLTEIPTLNPTDSIPFVNGDFTAIDSSHDGNILAVAELNRCTLYNLHDKSKTKTLELSDIITGISFSPIDNNLAMITESGTVAVYDTHDFSVKTTCQTNRKGVGISYDLSGYMLAIITDSPEIMIMEAENPDNISYIKRERDTPRQVCFLDNIGEVKILASLGDSGIQTSRFTANPTCYHRLVSSKVNRVMKDWLKMRNNETAEQFLSRINGEERLKMERELEYGFARRYTKDHLSGKMLDLKSYDKATGELELAFGPEHPLTLNVPNSEIAYFKGGRGVEIIDALYSVRPDNSFRMDYLRLLNHNNAKEYTYDVRMQNLGFPETAGKENFSEAAERELRDLEIKLNNLKNEIVNKLVAEHRITDDTNFSISVNLTSLRHPFGMKETDLEITFGCDIPSISLGYESYGNGNYHLRDSKIASYLTALFQQSVESHLKPFLQKCGNVEIDIDSDIELENPDGVVNYDGSYGEHRYIPIYLDGKMTAMNAETTEGITDMEGLALLRTLGIKNYIHENIAGIKQKKAKYNYFLYRDMRRHDNRCSTAIRLHLK